MVSYWSVHTQKLKTLKRHAKDVSASFIVFSFTNTFRAAITDQSLSLEKTSLYLLKYAEANLQRTAQTSVNAIFTQRL